MSERLRARRHEGVKYEEPRPFNPWSILCHNIGRLVNEAHEVRLEAIKKHDADKRRNPNHRKFYVAAAMLGADPIDYSHVTEVDINTMTREKGKRVCAEERTKARLDKANSVGRNYFVPGAVVLGEPQQDKLTGNDPLTLWPCGESCWPNIFGERRTVINDDTLVLTVLPLEVSPRTEQYHARFQIQRADEMDDFYKRLVDGGDPIEPPLFTNTEEEWASAGKRFDDLFPSDIDPFESEDYRQLAVNSAIMAIHGRRLQSV